MLIQKNTPIPKTHSRKYIMYETKYHPKQIQHWQLVIRIISSDY
jgi:hypothetical protein